METKRAEQWFNRTETVDAPEPDYTFDAQAVTNEIRGRDKGRIKRIQELENENHNLRRMLWTLYTED